MKALRHTEHMRQRYEDAVRGIEDLEAQLQRCRDAWQEAVLVEDPKAEAAANKRLQEAEQVLVNARSRLPILRDAIDVARRQAIPDCAEEVTAQLRALNDQATAKAAELAGHYEHAVELAKEVNGLFKTYRGIVQEFRALCREASAVVELPPEARFPVSMQELNARFLPDYDGRFRLSKERLLKTPAAEEYIGEPEAMAVEEVAP